MLGCGRKEEGTKMGEEKGGREVEGVCVCVGGGGGGGGGGGREGN